MQRPLTLIAALLLAAPEAAAASPPTRASGYLPAAILSFSAVEEVLLAAEKSAT